MEDADWHIQIDVNLTGTANALRAFAPYMVQQKHGRIIMTTSTQGRHGTLNGSAYSASKWGIIGLMNSGAMEVGPHGITVNLQVAGHMPTGDKAVDEEAARKVLQSRSILGVPWIDPAEMAPVVVFLASDL